MTRINNLLDVLKVQVEQETTGLQNLLANPSGDLGAWAWATRAGVLRNGSDANGSYLEFETALGGDVNAANSEAVPVIPGQYISASWFLISNTAPYLSAGFYFYDVAGAFQGSAGFTAYTNAPGIRGVVPPTLIPAGAVTARLQFAVSSAVAQTFPGAGKIFRYRQAIVATAATSGALATTYTNLIKNPSVETNLTGYSVISGLQPLARIGRWAGSAAPTGGAWAIQIIRDGTGNPSKFQTEEVAVTAGETYTARFRNRIVSSAISGRLTFYDAAHALLSDVPLVSSGIVTDKWNVVSALAPAGAAFARIVCTTFSTENHADQFLIMKGPDIGYFDGATPDGDGYDYGWTGTANASTSTAVASNLPFIPPVSYREVQGSAVAIGLQRRTFDSTLSCTIRDADLDPATATLLRPGRLVRVLAKGVLGDWKTLWTGKAARPAVDYGDLKRRTRPTITLTAYGPGADLAGTPVANGVPRIQDLPQVLEGIRVPFRVNGSDDQVPTVAAVSQNDQASALDQVILARDSQLGYAWTTKEGALWANTDRTLDYYGTGVATFEEGDYTQLALSYDPDQIINQVTVILLRFNASTGETEEVTYGPYIDYPSLREWGPSPAEYRVHGTIDPKVWATSILAANAQGQQRVDRLRVPITDTDQITETRALIDLYAKANVVNVDRAVDLDLRVLGIDHTISWTAKGGPKWYVDLLFGSDDAAAGPQAVTPVPAGDGIKDGVWYEVGVAAGTAFLNSWGNVGGTAATAAYMRKNGMVYLKGWLTGGARAVAAFALPPGFRPAQVRVMTGAATASAAASAGTAHTHGFVGMRFDIQQNGNVVPQGTATGSQSIECVFQAEA